MTPVSVASTTKRILCVWKSSLHSSATSESLRKAAEFFQKAADRGNAYAQYHLGWLYERGEGVPKDFAKAEQLYQKAADQGNKDAIASLKRLSGQPTERATASRQVSAETPTAIFAESRAPTSSESEFTYGAKFLKDQKDKVSYSLGMQIGSNLNRQKAEVNPDALAAGFKDAIAGKPQLSPDQVKDVMAQFEKDMEQKQKQLGEKNKTDGAKFLEDNKK